MLAPMARPARAGASHVKSALNNGSSIGAPDCHVTILSTTDHRNTPHAGIANPQYSGSIGFTTAPMSVTMITVIATG